MSDLREALETIARGGVPLGISPAKWAEGWLADHPVEPAGCAACISGDTENCVCFAAAPVQVEIPDAAVIRGHDVLQERWGPLAAVPILHSDVRAMLEAAAPLLGPRPLLDRDKVAGALVDFGAAVQGPDGAWKPAATLGKGVDAVMELARPMPTREQIHEVTREVTGYAISGLSEALLALLNGDTDA